MAQVDNLKVIEAVENALRTRNWDAFVNLHTEDVAHHSPDSPEPRRGRESLKDWYKGFVHGFPDLDAKTERLFADGEWVCGEYSVTGTHSGPLMGPAGETIPPTEKKVRVSNCSVYRVQGGKVAEVWEYFDQLSFMAQLGLTD